LNKYLSMSTIIQSIIDSETLKQTPLKVGEKNGFYEDGYYINGTIDTIPFPAGRTLNQICGPGTPTTNDDVYVISAYAVEPSLISGGKPYKIAAYQRTTGLRCKLKGFFACAGKFEFEIEESSTFNDNKRGSVNGFIIRNGFTETTSSVYNATNQLIPNTKTYAFYTDPSVVIRYFRRGGCYPRPDSDQYWDNNVDRHGADAVYFAEDGRYCFFHGQLASFWNPVPGSGPGAGIYRNGEKYNGIPIYSYFDLLTSAAVGKNYQHTTPFEWGPATTVSIPNATTRTAPTTAVTEYVRSEVRGATYYTYTPLNTSKTLNKQTVFSKVTADGVPYDLSIAGPDTYVETWNNIVPLYYSYIFTGNEPIPSNYLTQPGEADRCFYQGVTGYPGCIFKNHGFEPNGKMGMGTNTRYNNLKYGSASGINGIWPLFYPDKGYLRQTPQDGLQPSFDFNPVDPLRAVYKNGQRYSGVLHTDDALQSALSSAIISSPDTLKSSLTTTYNRITADTPCMWPKVYNTVEENFLGFIDGPNTGVFDGSEQYGGLSWDVFAMIGAQTNGLYYFSGKLANGVIGGNTYVNGKLSTASGNVTIF
jgi:hypothetical protein